MMHLNLFSTLNIKLDIINIIFIFIIFIKPKISQLFEYHLFQTFQRRFQLFYSNMLFCDSFSILQPTDPITGTGFLGLSLWPVTSQPIRSSLKSLSVSQLSGPNFTNELSQNSVLAVFSFIMKCDEFFISNDAKPFDFPIDSFRDCYDPFGFEHPIALSKNQGFCFILTGKKAPVLSRARCISLQQVVTARPLKAGSIFNIQPLFDLFPPLSQMSIRFPIVAPPHSRTTFFPTKSSDVKMARVSKSRKQGILWQKADKIQRWRLDLTQVTDSIFVGSSTVAQNGELLKRKEITHIINCASQLIAAAPGFEVLNIPMVDGGDENILSHIWKTTTFIINAISKGGRVLVNCIEGVSRSCSVIIAYLMLTENLDYMTAYKIVRKQRRCCSPHPKFMTQLMQLAEILGVTNTKSCPFSKDKIIPFEVIERRNIIIPLPKYDNSIESKPTSSGLIINFQNSSSLSKISNRSTGGTLLLKVGTDSKIQFVQCARETSKFIAELLKIESIIEEKIKNETERTIFSSPNWIEVNNFMFADADQANIYVSFEKKSKSITALIGKDVNLSEDIHKLVKQCCEAHNLSYNESFTIIDSRRIESQKNHVRFSEK